jgi:glutathione S-transferase
LPGDPAPDEARIGKSMKASARALDALADLAGGVGPLVGAELTLADLHAYPVLACFAYAPEGLALLQRHERLNRWMGWMRQRGSVQRTRSLFDT